MAQSIDEYDADCDFTDCEITCRYGVVVKATRHLLRVLPWFRNAFKFCKTLPAEIDLTCYSASIVRKIVDFCSPTMTLVAKPNFLPPQGEVAEFLELADFLFMCKSSLTPNILHTFVTNVLDPIGAAMTREMLVSRELVELDTSTNSDAVASTSPPTPTAASQQLRPPIATASATMTPHLIRYLYSHVSPKGWPADPELLGASGLLAILASGVSMRTILSRYPRSVEMYFTDEFYSLRSDDGAGSANAQDLKDVVVELTLRAGDDFVSLVHRLISVGVRPLIILDERVQDQQDPLNKASHAWRLGWPLSPFVIARNAVFKNLLDGIKSNEALTKDEVLSVRKLACIVDDIQRVANSQIVPLPEEVAALFGYYMSNNMRSAVLANPFNVPAESVYDLVDKTAESASRRSMLIRHLEKHDLHDDHRVASNFYARTL